MSPLQLLALIFIFVPWRQREVKVERRKEGEERVEEVEEEKKKKEEEEEEKACAGTLQRGDLLVVPRTLFTHFGIYLGGGRVAHFIPDIMPAVSSDPGRIARMVTNTRLLLGVLAKHGSVRVDSVDDFAYGSPVLVNTTDKVCGRPALQAEQVARRAESLLGHVTYSLLWYNCEHFVMYCRYGIVMSFQTFQFCKTMRKLLLSRRVAKAAALLGAGLLVWVGTVTVSSVLLAVLLPFLIWMAS